MRFATIAEYLRKLHPEFGFVLTIDRYAKRYWGYGTEKAIATQRNMMEIAYSQARRLDLSKNLDIQIESELPTLGV